MVNGKVNRAPFPVLPDKGSVITLTRLLVVLPNAPPCEPLPLICVHGDQREVLAARIVVEDHKNKLYFKSGYYS